jgi:hypothetical protein
MFHADIVFRRARLAWIICHAVPALIAALFASIRLLRQCGGHVERKTRQQNHNN